MLAILFIFIWITGNLTGCVGVEFIFSVVFSIPKWCHLTAVLRRDLLNIFIYHVEEYQYAHSFINA
eukprot:c14315_g1_i1 orf=8-205(-)